MNDIADYCREIRDEMLTRFSFFHFQNNCYFCLV